MFEKTHTIQRVVIHLRTDDDEHLTDIDGATVHVGNK